MSASLLARNAYAASLLLCLLAVPAQAQPADRGTGRSDLPVPTAAPTIDDIVAARQNQNGYRIVNGEEAKPGQWRSMVAIYIRRPNQAPFNFCGGTVIDRTWVLTAAHCAAAMKNAGSPPAVSFFVREGTVDLNGGDKHDVNVAEIISHEAYNPDLTLNDVALLRLAGPANAPPQTLVAKARVGEVAPPKMTTVIGFGLTQEGGTSSPKLRQVDLPVVARPACQQVYDSTRITDANFCAGRQQGGQDSCQGDSGGPSFVATAGGQPLQVGVVSWGRGCARPNAYGVYASVGNFEDWIKSKVPEAKFVARETNTAAGEAVKPLANGAEQNPAPSTNAQLTVGIVQGNRLKVGASIDIRVDSSVPGIVVVYNENPDGSAYQVYPSKTFPAPGSDPAVASVEAGKPLAIPSPQQRDKGFRIVVAPPLGANYLRAVVVPDREELREIIRQYAPGTTIPSLAALLNQLVAKTRGLVGINVNPTDRAQAEIKFDIVP